MNTVFKYCIGCFCVVVLLSDPYGAGCKVRCMECNGSSAGAFGLSCKSLSVMCDRLPEEPRSVVTTSAALVKQKLSLKMGIGSPRSEQPRSRIRAWVHNVFGDIEESR